MLDFFKYRHLSFSSPALSPLFLLFFYFFFYLSQAVRHVIYVLHISISEMLAMTEK